MGAWIRLSSIAGSLLLVALVGCSRKAPPNVLVVTFDTTRYDRFGCNGDSGAKTPTVDALAANGVNFDHAFASSPLTLTSHATIFTGLEPIDHGAHNNGNFRVPERFETLAERLKILGYDTAAFISAMVLHARYDLDQGFDVYDDRISPSRRSLDFSVPKRRGDETTDAALSWLAKGRSERPFFLWVHYFDAHLPYPMDIPRVAGADWYANAIAYEDAELGRLLEGVRRAEGPRGTLVVVTADHGESLGEHDEKTHGTVAYDSTLHVPLVIAGPGVPRGKRSQAFARHVDVVPTILTALGERAPRGADGRDLLRLVDARWEGDDTVGYFESHSAHEDLGWSPIEGVRTARWKYTAIPAPVELYDVRADPHERLNLADSEAEALTEMQRRWDAFRRDRESRGNDARLDEVPLETREELASLGYVQARQEYSPDQMPDPRKLVAATTWVEEARNLATLGRYDEAIGRLETLEQSASIKVLVLRTLAPIYLAVGRFDDAERAFRDDAELTGAEDARLGLAQVFMKNGRLEDALAELQSLDASSWKVATELARVLRRLGRREEARAAIEKGFTGPENERQRLLRLSSLIMEDPATPEGEADLRRILGEVPDDPTLRSRLGAYLVRLGRSEQRDEGLDLLRSAAKARPDDPDLLANLAQAAYAVGNDAEAVGAWGGALRYGGERAFDLFRSAFPLVRSGQSEKALERLRKALAREPGARWGEAARDLIARIERDRNPTHKQGAAPRPDGAKG